MTSQLDYDYLSPTKSNAPHLLFIHGAGGNKNQWIKQIDFFQKHGWGVVNLSLPSHGLSPSLESVSMDKYVEVVNELIIKQEFEYVSLIGHSMGGAIALNYVLQYNNPIIENLILIGTGAKLKVAPAIFEALETDFNLFLELLGNFAYHNNTPSQIKSSNEKTLRENKVEIFIKDFEICDIFDIRSELSKITTKTLIIVGQDDQATPVRYSTYLHDNLKYSQLVVIPEAGHYVFLEKPQDVNQQIYQFLTK